VLAAENEMPEMLCHDPLSLLVCNPYHFVNAIVLLQNEIALLDIAQEHWLGQDASRHGIDRIEWLLAFTELGTRLDPQIQTQRPER